MKIVFTQREKALLMAALDSLMVQGRDNVKDVADLMTAVETTTATDAFDAEK